LYLTSRNRRYLAGCCNAESILIFAKIPSQ
jgi:hypothetical protein